MVAASLASVIAFGAVYVLLGMMWGAKSEAFWLCGVAAGIAAAYAAATTRWGLAAILGVLGALWVLFELLAAFLGVLAASLG